MKTKSLLLAGVAVLLGMAAQAQLTIITNLLPPSVGPYDQYYLPGPVDEASGAMTLNGSDNTSSAANDSLTYVAFDKESKGQSFTTGSNPAGYTIHSITVRQILWTNFLSNGTFMNIPNGTSFDFAFGTISGTTLTPTLTTTATYSGATLNSGGTGGSGIYLTFDLSGAGIGTLSPNTTYYFEIASPATAYFELHNTRTNSTSYTGGTAFYGDTTANLDQSGVANLPPYGGEFAFVAKLSPVGAPSVVAAVNPASGNRGQSFTVTATVTPGNGTVTNVTVDLSSIGGSSAASLSDTGGNVWANTFNVPTAAPIGEATLTVTATDTTPLVASADVSFTVLPDGYVWDGGSSVDDKWSSSANWLGDLAPALSGNSVIFAGTTRPTPDLDANYSVSDMIFSNTAGSFNIISSTGSTLTFGAGGIVNNSASAQTLNVPIVLAGAQYFNAAAGSLTLNSNLSGSGSLAVSGAGGVTLAGTGTNTIGNLQVMNGTLKITAGTLGVSATQGNSKIDMGGTVEVDAGAVLTITNGSNAWFPLNDTAGTTSTLTVAGGTVNILNNWGMEVPRQGSAILNINAGSMTVRDSGGIGLVIGDQTAAESGTVNLNGGILTVNRITANNGAGKFYFNGGILKSTGSNASFFPATGTLTSYVRDGGAIIDTAGLNISTWPFLNHSDMGTDSAVDGGLTKMGNGTLTLSSGYGYSGPNIVLGGTLSVTMAQTMPDSSGDLVISNATLNLDASGGYGIIVMPAANVAFDDNAVLVLTNYPDVNAANAINGTGNVSFANNTSLNLIYGSLGGNPSAPAINVAGSASVSGTNNVINLSGSGFTIGEFPLIQYGSGSLASISGFRLGTLPAGISGKLTNDVANHWVAFNVTAVGQNLTWYGNNSQWDINTTANWNSGTAKYLEYGTGSDAYGDIVMFDDSLNTGVLATNISLAATLHPSQITMNNNSYPYVFSGPGSLAGPTTLVLDGTGSLTLQTSNSFTGGVVLNAGTLIVTNDDELGTNTGALSLNGGTLQVAGNMTSLRPVSLMATSVVEVVSGMTAQWSGAMTGAGSLTLTNQGTLTLSPSQTNAIGNLRLSSGHLNITSGTMTVTDTTGNATRIENDASLTVSGGTLNIVDGGNGWFPIGVTAGSTGMVMVAGGTINVRDHWGTEVGNESGAGVLTLNSGIFLNNDIGNIGLLVGETGSQGGTVNLNGGMLAVNKIIANAGGSFYFNGGTLSPVLNNGASFFGNSATLTAQVRNGGAIVSVGAGTNVTIAQPLLHSTIVGDNATDGGLIKSGSGTLNLSGANNYNGNTAIQAGILELSQSTPTLNTNSTVSIASGAVLQLDSSAVTNVVAGLFTNGVAAVSGLYSSANSSGFIAGSGYLQVGASVGPTGPGIITNSISGNTLTLAWPTGQGWRLQMQTNSLSKGLGTNWVYITDGSVSSTNITVDPTRPTVFYRLTYP